jgi:hypothetical protein
MTNKITQRKARPSGGKPRGGGRKTMRCSRGGGPKNDEMKQALRRLNTAIREETTTQNRVKSRQATLTTKQKSFTAAQAKHANATTANARQSASNAQVRIQGEVTTATTHLDNAAASHAENEQKRKNAQDAYDLLIPLAAEELQNEKEANAEKTAAAKAERVRKTAAANADREQKKADAAAKKAEDDAAAKKVKDDAVAKKKAEDAAAAKKKVEDDAVAKKKAEDDAAAKKTAEDDAVAKKKVKDDAAAKKKAEDDAAAKKKKDDAVEDKKRAAEERAQKVLKANAKNSAEVAFDMVNGGDTIDETVQLFLASSWLLKDPVNKENVEKISAALAAAIAAKNMDKVTKLLMRVDEDNIAKLEAALGAGDGSGDDGSGDDSSGDDSSGDDSSGDDSSGDDSSGDDSSGDDSSGDDSSGDDSSGDDSSGDSDSDSDADSDPEVLNVTKSRSNMKSDREKRRIWVHKMKVESAILDNVANEHFEIWGNKTKKQMDPAQVAKDMDATQGIEFIHRRWNNPSVFNTYESDASDFNEDDESDEDDFVVIEPATNKVLDLDAYYRNIPFFNQDLHNINNFNTFYPLIVDLNNKNNWQDDWVDSIITPLYEYINAKHPAKISETYLNRKSNIDKAISQFLGKNTKIPHTYDTLDALLENDADDTTKELLIIEFKWWMISDPNISEYTDQILDEVCKNMFYGPDSMIYKWMRNYVMYDGFMCGLLHECKAVSRIKMIMAPSDVSIVNSIPYKQMHQFLNNVTRQSFIVWAQKMIEIKDHGPLSSEEPDQSSYDITRAAGNTLNKIRRSGLRTMVKMRNGPIRQVVEAMLPTYYYWIIYDTDGRLKPSTRKYIYDIMSKSAIINTPGKARDTMFNMHKLLQQNIGDVGDISGPYSNYHDNYNVANTVSFDDHIVDELKVGSKIQSNIHGRGKLLDGVIDKVNNNGTFGVKYNTGEEDPNLNKSMIRTTGNSNTWKTTTSMWDMCITFNPEYVTNLTDDINILTNLYKKRTLPNVIKEMSTELFVKKGCTYYFMKGSRVDGDDNYKYSDANHLVGSVYGSYTSGTKKKWGEDPYFLFGDKLSPKIWDICLYRMFDDLRRPPTPSPSQPIIDRHVSNIQITRQPNGRVIASLSNTFIPTAVPVTDGGKETDISTNMGSTSGVVSDTGLPQTTANIIGSSSDPVDTLTVDNVMHEVVYLYNMVFETYIQNNNRGEDLDITGLVDKTDPNFPDLFSNIINELLNETMDKYNFTIFEKHNTPIPNANDIKVPNKIYNDLFSSVFLYLHTTSQNNHAKTYSSINGSIPCNDPVISGVTTKDFGTSPPTDMPSLQICDNKDMYGTLYKFVSLSSLETIDNPDEIVNYTTPTPESSSTEQLNAPYVNGAIDRITLSKADISKNIFSATKKEMMEKYISPIGKDNAPPKVDLERMGTWGIGYKSSDPSYSDNSPHTATFDDAMRAKTYAFFDKNTNGVLRSKKTMPYVPEMMSKLEGFQSIMLANQEAGYIYHMSAKVLHFHFSSTFRRGHYPIAVYLEFSGVHNKPDTKSVPYTIHREDALLWLDPDPSMKKTIEIANPRLYHGMMKHIWAGTPDDPVPENDELGEEDEKDEKDDGRPVPVRLGGSVYTTVPGFQNMRMSPSMFGIPKSKTDKVIRVNPTVKLSRSAINAAPEEDRKQQFFDYGLFYTLNSRAATESSTGIPDISFKRSVKSHILDHNIKLTLESLFAPGTVVYLGSEPYTIYSSSFDETKWRLGPSDAIEPDLTVGTIMDAQMIHIQEKNAVSEMQAMADVLKVGDGISTAEVIPVEYKFVKGSDKGEDEEDEDLNLPIPMPLPKMLPVSKMIMPYPIPSSSTALIPASNKIEKTPVGRHLYPIPGQPRIPTMPYIPKPVGVGGHPNEHLTRIVNTIIKTPPAIRNNAILNQQLQDFFINGPRHSYKLTTTVLDDKGVPQEKTDTLTIGDKTVHTKLPKHNIQIGLSHLRKAELLTILKDNDIKSTKILINDDDINEMRKTLTEKIGDRPDDIVKMNKILDDHKEDTKAARYISSHIAASPNYFNMLDALNTSAIKSDIPNLFRIASTKPGQIQKMEGKKTKKGQKKNDDMVFNKLNYKNSMDPDGSRTIKTLIVPGDGDCFFSCIATALNMYNEKRDSKKNYINNYTFTFNNTIPPITVNKFTPKIVRAAIINEFCNHPDLMLVKLLRTELYINGNTPELSQRAADMLNKMDTQPNDPVTKEQFGIFMHDHFSSLPAPGDGGWNAQLLLTVIDIINAPADAADAADADMEIVIIISRIETAISDMAKMISEMLGEWFTILPFDHIKTIDGLLEHFNSNPIFTCIQNESDAYDKYMQSDTWASENDIAFIPQVFDMLPVIIQATTNTTQPFTKKINDATSITKTTTSFATRVNRSTNVNVNKSVFILYNGTSHYDLIVFNSSTKGSSTDLIATGGSRRTRRARRTGGTRRSGGTRRTHSLIGGSTDGKDKDVIFDRHRIPDINIGNPAQQKKGIIFDEITNMPIYMIMLLYQGYNTLMSNSLGNGDKIFYIHGIENRKQIKGPINQETLIEMDKHIPRVEQNDSLDSMVNTTPVCIDGKHWIPYGIIKEKFGTSDSNSYQITNDNYKQKPMQTDDEIMREIYLTYHLFLTEFTYIDQLIEQMTNDSTPEDQTEVINIDKYMNNNNHKYEDVDFENSVEIKQGEPVNVTNQLILHNFLYNFRTVFPFQIGTTLSYLRPLHNYVRNYHSFYEINLTQKYIIEQEHIDTLVNNYGLPENIAKKFLREHSKTVSRNGNIKFITDNIDNDPRNKNKYDMEYIDDDLMFTEFEVVSEVPFIGGGDRSMRGGAAPVGRDANRFTTTDASGSPLMNTMNTINPTAIAMDPTTVLSEHVMRIMNDDSSSLSFKVDVHLILAPGDEGIGVGDKVGYACESSRQDMRRSWSEITGKTYYPTPRKE